MSIKSIISWSLVLSFATFHSPSVIYCDHPEKESQALEESENQLETTPLDEEDSEENIDPQGTEVTPAAYGKEKAKNKELMKNLLIAGVAVIVAVVSILVVSNNNGSKK